ncbi:hypothetical protein BXO87_01935 [Bacillus sp. GZB]|nr:hypothetical protein BXO87_01935 [Bacillus sp. GZB]
MVFFSSRHRVNKLSFLSKLWMTPAAYLLKFLAGGVISMADKFDEKVTLAIVSNTTLKGDIQ